MLQLKNATPFVAQLMVLPNAEGVDTLFTLVKGTFAIGARSGTEVKQVPVVLADEHYADPATSSVRAPSDVALGKPGTDVLLVGSAWASHGKPTWQMDVSVSAGPVTKSVRVFGDRVWDAGPSGATISWVAPFERMPLVWERAFGGMDQTDKGPVAEARNPVGAGFKDSRGAKPLDGLPLPNVEDPTALISSWKDAPPPAGFAAIAPHWEPRKSFAGTYDDVWQRERAPYLPKDFDARFFHSAPAGLVAPGHLRGGELIDVRGATPDGMLRFLLPSLNVQIIHRLDAALQPRTAVLDTVIIEPDEGRLVLLWRAALPCDKAVLKVKEVTVNVAQA